MKFSRHVDQLFRTYYYIHLMLEQPTVPDHGGDIHDEHLIVGVNLHEMLNNHLE
jgi:hypothetical protein